MNEKHVPDGGTMRGLRVAAWCAALALLSPVAFAAEPDAEAESSDPAPESSPTDESLSNWIDVVVGGVAIGGRDVAFKRRFGGPQDNFFGGIEDFHYEVLTDSGTFQMDGHALPGLEDYELKLRYDRDEIGFVRFGFREFRTWSDGSGGYLPRVAPPSNWIEPERDELGIDRGEVGLEAGLRMPDLPHLTIAYWHRWRDGMTDSTVWGRLGGGGLNGIIPSYWDIDETVDIFKFDVIHTLQSPGVEITLGGGMRYHRVRSDNSRQMHQGKGAAAGDDDRRVSQEDNLESDFYNAHLFSEFRIDEEAIASVGYSFTTMDTNIGGDRFSFDRDGDLRTSSDHSYFSLMGGSQTAIHVVNANVWWNPIEDLVVVPSVRGEFWDQSAMGYHLAGIRGAPDGTLEGIRDRSDYEYATLTEQLELRYSGVPDVLLTAKGQLSQGDGDFSRSSMVDDLMGTITRTSRSNNLEFDQEKITVGVNWYPIRKVSVAGQYHYRRSERNYDDHVVIGDDAQIRNYEAATHDLNFRFTVRPLPNVTVVSRYDYQQTEIKNRAFSGLPGSTTVTPQVASGDITRHIFSESVTWVPFDWLYLQGSFHYIESSTNTGADRVSGFDSRLVPDWSNDYWMLHFNAGIELGDRTNLQVGYFYYDADNFVDNSDVGTPYGTEAKEHALTVRLNQQITPAMSWNLGYGFFKGEDDAYGGNRDYDAHVVSSGFRYSF